MYKTTLIVLIALLSSCKQKNVDIEVSKTDGSAITDSITTALQEVYNRGHINGFSVAIVNDSATLYTKGFGYADVATQKPYTQNTVQNIASISKTFIGVSLLKAQEMGKLSLDDPINSYLPYEVKNPNHPEAPITIRHLSTHTSSIMDTDFYGKSYVMKDTIQPQDSTIVKIPDYFNGADTRIPMAEFLEKTLSPKGIWYQKEGFLEQRPGERFEYSNIGATLAAQVLELATGVSFPEFTQIHILKPLGMSASGWSFDAINFEDHARLYTETKTPLPFYSLITYPDGGFTTSSIDMGKYLNELIKGHSGQGTLLKQTNYRELFKKQLQRSHFVTEDGEETSEDENNAGIFMGFMDDGLMGHSGGDPGISSRMFFDPNSGLGRILIINTDPNKEGYQEFLALWETLENFGTKLNQ
jgi:CubicO group peptidase (beta-lactamase class C family)